MAAAGHGRAPGSPAVAVVKPGSVAVLDGHKEAVVRLTFSPDGLTLVSDSTGERDSSTRVWNLRTLAQSAVLVPSGPSAFSADGSRWVTGSGKANGSGPRPVEVIDAKNWKSLGRLGIPQAGHLAIDKDGSRVAASSGSELTVRDVKSGAELRRLAVPDPKGGNLLFLGLCLSPDGQRVAAVTGWEPKWVHCWDVKTGNELFVFKPPVEQMRFIAGGQKLFLAGFGNWYVLDAAGAQLAHGYPASAYSADGDRALRWKSEDKDGAVGVIDAGTVKELGKFRGAGARVVTAALSADGRLAATCDENRVVCLWRTEDQAEVARTTLDASAQSVAVSPDGGTVAVGGTDGKVRLWGAPSAPRGADALPAAFRDKNLLRDGQRVELLPAIQTGRDVRSGKVEVGKDGSLRCEVGAEPVHLVLPAHVPAGVPFDLEIDYTRTEKKQGTIKPMHITLPAAEPELGKVSHFTVVEGGMDGNIFAIKPASARYDAGDNAAKSRMTSDLDLPAKLLLSVKATGETVTLDASHQIGSGQMERCLHASAASKDLGTDGDGKYKDIYDDPRNDRPVIAVYDGVTITAVSLTPRGSGIRPLEGGGTTAGVHAPTSR